ncbi:MAG TPA: hypothetical protein VLZ89_16510 [Anaerolineales bacterium]|nr:hypothetical protein [Anaerolineales bacterium]
MEHIKRGRDDRTLWGLMLLAILVGGLFHFLHTLSGNDEADGLFAVLLGLYICSKPATHVVDMLIFGRDIRHWISMVQSDLGWTALNLLVILSGLSLIVVGTTRFFRGG